MSCNIVCYGAGKFGKQIVHILKQYEEINVQCYLDGKLKAEQLEGIQIYEPSQIAGIEYDYILLCSMSSFYKQEMKTELLKWNVKEERILEDPLFKPLQKYLSKKNKVRFAKDMIYLIFQKEKSDQGLEVGDFTWYVPHIHGHEKCARVKIGKFSGIADDVIIFRGGEVDWKQVGLYEFFTAFDGCDAPAWEERSKGNVVIGNDVLVHKGVKILSGVTIGDGAVVAANSLVGVNIPPYAVAWGVPAKVMMYRFDKTNIEKLLEMQWWDWENELLYDAIPLIQSKNVQELYDYYLHNVIRSNGDGRKD